MTAVRPSRRAIISAMLLVMVTLSPLPVIAVPLRQDDGEG
jgi:hypothetical protein